MSVLGSVAQACRTHADLEAACAYRSLTDALLALCEAATSDAGLYQDLAASKSRHNCTAASWSELLAVLSFVLPAPKAPAGFASVFAGIERVVSAHGLVPAVQGGHLAPVVSRILQLLPPSHIAELLLPVGARVASQSHQSLYCSCIHANAN
jgi:hypothetical protein